MSLIFMDGFDANDFSLKGYYGTTGSQSTTTTTRYSNGRSLILGADSFGNWGWSYRSFPAVNKLFMGLAIINPSVSKAIIKLYGDSGATNHLILQLTASGALQLVCGSTTLATTVATYNWAAWHYLEISATIATTTGTVTVRLDNSVVLNFTGTTKNGGTNNTVDAMQFGINNASAYFDDLYLLDDTGTANNNFLGEVRIQTIFPTAAGASTQLSPTGVVNNWDNVNDIPPNTATYNSSSTTGNRDTYTMGDLSAASVTVLALQTSTTMKKLDAGVGSMKPAVKSGVSVYYGATQSLSASPLLYLDKFENDPATAAPWTQTSVNAAEFGAEVV